MDFPPSDPGTESLPVLFNPARFELPVKEETFRILLQAVEHHEEIAFSLLEVVFVDEETIVRINKEFLGKEYVTDIITFRYDEGPGLSSVEGTLYCCAPRIAEQADELQTESRLEFCRIFIHGLLHLAGYEDQRAADRQMMREREEFYLRTLI